MISILKGKVEFLGNGFVILNVNDVGYKISLSASLITEAKIGEEKKYFTYTHVKEDILALYGFASYNELGFFELLLSVSGVGPKAALNILSAAPFDRIKESISKQDPALLYSVSGIGKKTAEKIVIELKNKLGVLAEGNIFNNATDSEDIVYALEELGYSRSEIIKALSSIGDGNVEDRLKDALKVLSKR